MRPGFWTHDSGSTVEYFAVGAALVAAAALFLGYSAQQWASEGEMPSLAFVSSDQYVAKKSKPPGFDSIDYSTTGATNRRSVVLDPCTGRQKSE
ncbi:MAG: hypothetical protein ABSG83_12455 [Roseiarcus sp.]|jgi:hypothetical protein